MMLKLLKFYNINTVKEKSNWSPCWPQRIGDGENPMQQANEATLECSSEKPIEVM